MNWFKTFWRCGKIWEAAEISKVPYGGLYNIWLETCYRNWTIGYSLSQFHDMHYFRFGPWALTFWFNNRK